VVESDEEESEDEKSDEEESEEEKSDEEEMLVESLIDEVDVKNILPPNKKRTRRPPKSYLRELLSMDEYREVNDFYHA